MEEKIRKVLETYGNLSIDVATLDVDANLYEAGLTSRASVAVMLGIENEFDFEFPEDVLSKQMFSSINNLIKTINLGITV
ncbi:acyl carrier protein [Bacillus cereus group sp. MYBK108-2]|uniref:acyl carrier protein n=1 Tax=unclassified Bacillus cereus group TaxID=2750818 RepID=UPI00288D2070|nr:acyl carrier protein [Bacillus cereus]MDA2307633.1 acyl carrier protein [Bacillus cereus]HDX9634234.1 acyl carrier protein [Bacillus cereus]HEF1897121.1 acyl carrier protein [Bacillus cereus]